MLALVSRPSGGEAGAKSRDTGLWPQNKLGPESAVHRSALHRVRDTRGCPTRLPRPIPLPFRPQDGTFPFTLYPWCNSA